GDPEVDMATQMVDLQDKIGEGNSAGSSLGTLWFAESISTFGPFSALTDIPGLARTVTTKGGRVRLVAQVPLSSSVAGDIVAITIQEGSTILAGAQDIVPSVGGFLDLTAERVVQ